MYPPGREDFFFSSVLRAFLSRGREDGAIGGAPDVRFNLLALSSRSRSRSRGEIRREQFRRVKWIRETVGILSLRR